MSIFDDVKKAAVDKTKVSPSPEPATEALGGNAVQHEGGSGFASQSAPNNMGTVTTDDGHGHAQQWLSDGHGGFFHP